MSDESNVIEIFGRNRYSNGANTVVEIEDEHRQHLLFRIHGGYVETRDRSTGFEIVSKHPDGTDFEHDSAYVVQLEGSGFAFDGMMGSRVFFTGVLLKGSWYDPDFKFEAGAKTPHSGDTNEIYVCEDTEYYHPEGAGWPAGHLVMPFTPPKRKIKALPVRITVSLETPEVAEPDTEAEAAHA